MVLYLQPAVNRQPGYRRGDREVVGRANIIFSAKKIFFFISKFFKIFMVPMHLDDLKIIPDDYEVSISSKLISQFANPKMNVKYWIALEKSSTFGV